MNAITHETIDTTSDDLLLMQRVQAADAGALRMIYDRHCGILSSVIYRVLNDAAETEDVLQEVLLQVWARAHTYSPKKGKPLSWLTTVAKRRAIDRIRQRCAYSRATDRMKESGVAEMDGAAESEVTEANVEQSDLRSYLDGLLRNLPDAQRVALEMAFYRSMSQREIAAQTRTPLGTVKTRIELGLRKLMQSAVPIRQKIW